MLVLRYNNETERFNNFHCGEVFEIKINNKWKTVRIEVGSNGWYLIDEDGFTCDCNKFEGYEIKEQ